MSYRSSRSGRAVPGLMRFSTEAAKCGAADEMSVAIEDITDGAVDRDKTLR